MAAAPEVDLAFLLNQTGYALTTEMAVGLAGLGITPRMYCVLLKAQPGDRTQNEVAELAALDKTTMVVTLDELEKAGLAERKTSSTDRRARLVVLTKSGEKTLAQANKIVRSIYDGVLGVLPARERDGFVSALTRLAEGRLATPSHLERPVRRRSPRGGALVP